MTNVSSTANQGALAPRAAGSYRSALDRLADAQKSSKGAPAYSRFVNRRAGRYLAAAAYRLGLTPNAVTAISALFSFAGIAVLIFVEPSWWSGALVTATVFRRSFDTQLPTVSLDRRAGDRALEESRGGGADQVP